MENKSNDSLIKNNLFKKINFERNSSNFSFGISKSLWYFLFLKIYIFLCLFVYLIFEFKKEKNEIKKIISLIKRYLLNDQSLMEL
jgi:hypothetical protein